MHRIIFIIFLVMGIAGCTDDTVSIGDTRSVSPGDVMGRTWQWESTVTPADTVSVIEPERYTFLLTDSGRAQVLFDCNQGGGEYKISEGTLTFGPMMSTMMACPGDSQNALFTRDLAKVDSFYLEDGFLYLELSDSSGTMRFSAVP